MQYRALARIVATTSLAALAMAPALAGAAQSDDIKINLERPVNGSRVTGINVITGWAVAPAGIDRVELFIDDGSTRNQVLAYGGSRKDVCRGRSPTPPDCPRVGFASTFSYNLLNDGEHTFTVRAYDNDGDFNEDSATFTINSFGENFVDGDRLSLPAFQISNVFKANSGSDNQRYDVEFEWRTAAQQFVMTDITERPNLVAFLLPDAPSGLTASTSGGDVELNWSDSTTSGDFGQESWFVVERKFSNFALGIDTDFEVVGVAGPDTTTFTDSTATLSVAVAPGTYTYRVLAAVPSGTSASGTATVTQTQDTIILEK